MRESPVELPGPVVPLWMPWAWVCRGFRTHVGVTLGLIHLPALCVAKLTSGRGGLVCCFHVQVGTRCRRCRHQQGPAGLVSVMWDTRGLGHAHITPPTCVVVPSHRHALTPQPQRITPVVLNKTKLSDAFGLSVMSVESWAAGWGWARGPHPCLSICSET